MMTREALFTVFVRTRPANQARYNMQLGQSNRNVINFPFSNATQNDRSLCVLVFRIQQLRISKDKRSPGNQEYGERGT